MKLVVPGSREVTEHVRSGEVDIGITFALAPQPEIRVLRRINGAVLAFAGVNHPYAGRSNLTLKDLEQVPMFLMGPHTTGRQLFDMACAQEGVAINLVLETTSSATIHLLVAAGAGLSAASFLSMAKHVKAGEVVALPLDYPILSQRSIQVQVLTGRRLPLIVEEFLQCLDEVIAELEPFAPDQKLHLPD